MSTKSRELSPDPVIESITGVLRKYEQLRPGSKTALYRRNPATIRVRVVDPGFRGQVPSRREESVWPVLDELPEETVQEIGFLLLLTPEEAEQSSANAEFESPTASPWDRPLWTLDLILDALSCHRQRATYGAVGGVLGLAAHAVMHGRPRDPRHSWVVNQMTGLPTDYAPEQLAPDLQSRPEILCASGELRRWLVQPR